MRWSISSSPDRHLPTKLTRFDDGRICSRRRPTLLALCFLFSFFLVGVALHETVAWFRAPPPPRLVSPERITLSDSGITKVLRELYQPLVPPVDLKQWKSVDGRKFRIKGPPIYTKPLKKDILILDVDSRPRRRKDAIGFHGRLDWSRTERVSAGLMNHYMYAQLHGYDYQFVRPLYKPDRHLTWYKVPAIAEALKTHQFVVFLDADAVFAHPELPFEWLLNHWAINRTVAVATALEPYETQNFDVHGALGVNTGFMVVQRVAGVTDEILRAWQACPRGERYPGCRQFRFGFPHEQGAYSSFLRYDYEPYLRELPCDEANGSPGEGSNCSGALIRHQWGDKHNVRDGVSRQLAQVIMERLHAHYIEEEDEVMTKKFRPPKGWGLSDDEEPEQAELPWR